MDKSYSLCPSMITRSLNVNKDPF